MTPTEVKFGSKEATSRPARARTRSFRRRRLVHRARGAESREGVAPSHAGLQSAFLARDSAHGADSGNRTRIFGLEDLGPTIGRCPHGGIGETRYVGEGRRLSLASFGCRPKILPLKYDPMFAGRERIERSLRGLEARRVTMTLRPVRKARRSLAAPRRGIEPLSSDRQSARDPVASRGMRNGGDGRGSNPPPHVHSVPSSPDEYRHQEDEKWIVVGSHHVLLGFGQALSLD